MEGWKWPWRREPGPGEALRLELEQSLQDTRVGIAQAYAGFNAAADGDLVESYIYEIQALRARYCYLLRQRKALEESAQTALRPGAPAALPVA